MSELPVLTKEFTLQLERHVAPESGAAGIVRFGKTLAKRVSGYWPPSAVYCFGAGDVGRLPEILGHFGEIDPVFYLSHAEFSPELGMALSEKGFFVSEWIQTVMYGLPSRVAPVLGAEITIEPVTAATVADAAEVASLGNEWAPEWRDSAKDGVRHSLGKPGYRLFLARFNGQPAGVGDFALSASGWGTLGGAAVIPRFRGKGLHSKLIEFRLHEAAKLGCTLVVGCANFGSASFRNQQRLGMRLAYVEAAWVKRR